MPIFNSSDPLQPNEELYEDCGLGLDKEITDYIKENHSLQILIGGEPFYFYQRMALGSIVTGTISSWDQTSSQYMKILWSPGNSNHPDLRFYTGSGSGTFRLYENGVPLNRIFDKNDLLYNNEFALEAIVGEGVSTKGQVKLYLKLGYIPSGVITYSYNVLCECVNPDTNAADMECPICYGAGFPLGWIKYNCDGTKYNPENTILIRVPKTDFIIPFSGEGLVKKQVNRHWALAIPSISNYDLIVGTIGNNINSIFEITNKKDSYFRGIFMHQEFDTILLEEADIRYQMVKNL